MHNGIDIGVNWGTPVRAICSGWITSSGNKNPMGAGPNSVVQQCGDWLVLYGHLSATESGFKNAGDKIGASGNPGGCSTCKNDHLHLEVRRKNSASTTYSSNAVNPVPLFSENLRSKLSIGDLVCKDAMNQPDIIYGQASKCKQWCDCPNKC
jgi:murein DD-endopeptidase MepM/ murein hydrolase activator NlpD